MGHRSRRTGGQRQPTKESKGRGVSTPASLPHQQGADPLHSHLGLSTLAPSQLPDLHQHLIGGLDQLPGLQFGVRQNLAIDLAQGHVAAPHPRELGTGSHPTRSAPITGQQARTPASRASVPDEFSSLELPGITRVPAYFKDATPTMSSNLYQNLGLFLV